MRKSSDTPQGITKLPIHPTLLTLVIFVLATLWFNRFALKELANPDPWRSYAQDTVTLQYFAQRLSDNIKSGRNPLGYIPELVYPFGIAAAGIEVGSIHLPYFLTLGAIFNPHHTFMLIIIITLFLAEVATYAFARALNLSRVTSTLSGIAFAFTPFISALRITQHYTYLHHFCFPLSALALLKLYQAKGNRQRLFYAVVTGVTTALIAYITFYFLIMWVITVALFCVSYAYTHKNTRHALTQHLRSLLPSLALAVGVFALGTAPLTLPLINIASLHASPKTALDLGHTAFAAHPLAIFIPSPTNPVYSHLFARSPFQTPESVIYLGLVGFWGLYQFIRTKDKRAYLPLFLTIISLYILTLGPKLKINSLPLPLPFTLFLHLPILSMLRAPARFGIVLSFCTTLLFAYMLDLKYKKRPPLKALLLIAAVIVVDQGYNPTDPAVHLNLPLKAYDYIKKDPNREVTVMELPYQIRDGIQGLGNAIHTQILLGQYLHGKNMMGGYVARLSDSHFNFYKSCTLTAYTLYVSESDRQPPFGELDPAAYPVMEEAADLFDLKYVLLSPNLAETATIAGALKRIGYTQTLTDPTAGYDLYTRTPKPAPATVLTMTTPHLECFLTGGWSAPFAGARWLSTASPQGGFFLKSPVDHPSFSLEAAAVRSPRRVDIVINHHSKTTITLTPDPTTYHLDLPLHRGLNHVDLFVRDQTPATYLPSPANTYLIAVSAVGLTDTLPEIASAAGKSALPNH